MHLSVLLDGANSTSGIHDKLPKLKKLPGDARRGFTMLRRIFKNWKNEVAVYKIVYSYESTNIAFESIQRLAIPSHIWTASRNIMNSS